jgi:hypothetical protein
MNPRDVDLPRIIRHAGDLLGFVLTAAFLVAALVCWSRYGRHLAIAGIPPFETATLQLLMRDAALPLRVIQWLLAWAWLVACGGCAVLALAGLRWSVVRARELLLDLRR